VETGFPKRSCFTKKLERQSIQSETIPLQSLIRACPDGWKPVFGKGHAQETLEPDGGLKKAIPIERPDLRGSQQLAVLVLEHDPEKWIPVFGQDHAQTKQSRP
jgi:hypothetical protein